MAIVSEQISPIPIAQIQPLNTKVMETFKMPSIRYEPLCLYTVYIILR